MQGGWVEAQPKWLAVYGPAARPTASPCILEENSRWNEEMYTAGQYCWTVEGCPAIELDWDRQAFNGF